MKVVAGLGNPGTEYQATRHNVGWWLLDLLQAEWRFNPFRRAGQVLATEGRFQDQSVRLIKPLTYMNRSGSVLVPYRNDPAFDIRSDLLVLVDDVNLPAGKLRFRASGSAGGHNGLKSIEAVLQSQEYARLRIGVDPPPPGEDLADWVLSSFAPEQAAQVREALPAAVAEVEKWLTTTSFEAAPDRSAIP